jgi:hypothetical protein
MRTIIFFSFFVFQLSIIQAQQVKGRVLDSGSKEPIPYANVIFGEHKGVVTNEEGFFSFTSEEIPAHLEISSLGYETLELRPQEIANGIVYLKPANIELKEVFLSNKELSPREIVELAKEKVADNYDFDLGQKRVFYRESDFSHIRKFDMKVEESTIPGIDQNLMDRIVAEMPKMTDSYKEVLADIYGNYDSQKVRIVKAANLYNPQNTQSLDQLTEHLETLFRQNLKERSFLKIKSGLLGVKVNEEELREGFEDSDADKKKKTPEEIAKKEAKQKKYLKESTGKEIQSLLGNMFWKEDIDFNLFEKIRKYEFDLQGILHLGQNTVYVINFEPKRRADFKGKIFIDAVDYGVHRIEYDNVRPLSKFRLFGISAIDDIYRGKMIFAKNEDGKYSISYLEREQGETVGIDRPLTIIEKNRHVPGRNKQNELDLELDMRFGQVEKVQLVVYENRPLQTSEYEAAKEQEAFEYQKFKSYNPDFWNGYNIIEPNAAIKKFSAFESE